MRRGYIKMSVEKILDDLESMLSLKQAQYGDTFDILFNEYKDYPVIMLEMKLLRLKKAWKNDPSEGLDSLMDLAGYAVLTMAAILEKEYIEHE